MVYVKLFGNIEDIKVVPAPLDSITKEIAGVLARTIMLPYTIFTKPQKLLPGLND